MEQLLLGDSVEVLSSLPSNSVQTCVTSPPYYNLRDYGVEGQLGTEDTPEEYVDKLVAIFRGVRRVLCDSGTVWLNLGDTYNGNKKGNTNGVYSNGIEDKSKVYAKTSTFSKSIWNGAKEKDLIGIPWMVAFALRNDGWYLRQDIIWAKKNPMTESVRDRCTKSHEYIFLLSKNKNYYFDVEAIKEPAVTREGRPSAIVRDRIYNYNSKQKALGRYSSSKVGSSDTEEPAMKRKRDVWFVASDPYKGAHFATFPPKLIEPCILAGSKIGDTVLDPFNGSGTTGQVAKQHGRNYIGIDINPSYLELTRDRLDGVA